MKALIGSILFQLCCSTMGLAQAKINSVLATGDFYKLTVKHHGVYKIDYTSLLPMGIDPDLLDPRNIKIYGIPTGMLPQSNNEAFPDDLTELAIYVEGEADGVFHQDDYIAFYAEGPDLIAADPMNRQIHYQKNLYDEANYYFLTVSSEKGKRISTRENLAVLNTHDLTCFDGFIHHEKELINLVKSGRYWLGENLAEDKSLTLTYDVPICHDSGQVSLQVRALSQASTTTELRFTINGAQAGSLQIKKSPFYQYGEQGQVGEAILSFHDSLLQFTDKLEITVENLSGSSQSLYLDWMRLNFTQPLKLETEPIIFRVFESTDREIVRYVLQAKQKPVVWDITEYNHIKKCDFFWQNGKAYFTEQSTYLHTYVAFDPQYLPSPEILGKISPQNLHGLTAPELLIITVDAFREAATKLAQHRQSFSNLTVEVVTVDQIYHEFSSGRQDVTAIRNFIRHLYQQERLKYVLLMGDASYDYKSKYPDNTNMVPTYQSFESVHNVLSFASDDYFAFMDQEEGLWSEKGINNDHLMDLSIGRLPVNSVTEALNLVNKIIHYETDPASIGDWRTKLAFFADDGDNNKHQLQSDFLASQVEQNYADFNPDRIMMDRYPKQQIDHNSYRSPEMVQILDQYMKEGTLILDFIGHGAETAWTNEYIFSVDMIENWKNQNNLPLFLTATCEFGRFDDWARQSGAERLLLKPDGGAIALLTTTRPVFFTTNFALSRAFYDAVFEKYNQQWKRLGDVFLETKNNAIEGVINRNFSLLGDPSMTLAYPQNEIYITGINQVEEGSNGVLYTGEIKENGIPDQQFNGKLEYVVYDSPSQIETLGNQGEATKFTFENREDILFRGLVNVVKGQFEFSHIIPQELLGDSVSGKISLYAWDSIRHKDAMGNVSDLKFLLDSGQIFADTIPPEISYEIDDQPAYSDINYITYESKLMVSFFDESGLGFKNLQNQEDLPAIVGFLSGTQTRTLDLTDMYKPEVGDFRSGSLLLSLADLEPGQYTLTVVAYDLYGNEQQATISFYIYNQVVINTYPNPADQYFNLAIHFPQEGQTYQIHLQLIYAYSGAILMNRSFSSKAKNKLIKLDKGHYQPGMYLYKIIVEQERRNAPPPLIKTGKFLFLE
ncbi:MAG: type IX secretion system sortase PorU [Candidatus Cyclobacteriaceae bacterium M3_2C_046]